MKIALSTDHAGFEKLQLLQKFLEDKGYECLNFGPKSYDPNDDYPDFMLPAAKAVSKGECEYGIILGGSGQGEAIAANRIKGVRCMVYYGPAATVEAVDREGQAAADEYETLRLSRQHNDANMLSLAARFVSQADMEHVVIMWLNTSFSGAERHARRIKKLDEFEN